MEMRVLNLKCRALTVYLSAVESPGVYEAWLASSGASIRMESAMQHAGMRRFVGTVSIQDYTIKVESTPFLLNFGPFQASNG